MTARDFRPETKRVVAATYAYFLLFAQFGFLRALSAVTMGDEGVTKLVLNCED